MSAGYPATADIAAVVLAFKAVDEVQSRAYKAFAAQHPDSRCSGPYLDEYAIVATALYFFNEANLDTDVHPYSRAGDMVRAFAQACMAMRSYSEAETCMLEEGGPYGSHCAPDLLTAFKREDESAAP